MSVDKWAYEEMVCEFVKCPGFCDECPHLDEAQEEREIRPEREYKEQQQEDWNNPRKFDAWRNGSVSSFNYRRNKLF